MEQKNVVQQKVCNSIQSQAKRETLIGIYCVPHTYYNTVLTPAKKIHMVLENVFASPVVPQTKRRMVRTFCNLSSVAHFITFRRNQSISCSIISLDTKLHYNCTVVQVWSQLQITINNNYMLFLLLVPSDSLYLVHSGIISVQLCSISYVGAGRMFKFFYNPHAKTLI